MECYYIDKDIRVDGYIELPNTRPHRIIDSAEFHKVPENVLLRVFRTN